MTSFLCIAGRKLLIKDIKGLKIENTFKLYHDRISKLFNLLSNSDKHPDNYTIFKDENIFYLTGFYGKDSNSILFISSKNKLLLVNFIYYEEAKRTCSELGIEVVLYKKNRLKELAQKFLTLKTSVIGIEGDQVDYISFLKLRNLLRPSGKRIIGKRGIIEKLRLIKHPVELENVRNACRITDKVFKVLLSKSQDQVKRSTELELGLKIERLMIKTGGYGRSFDFVIANGTGSSMPHYITGHNKIKSGVLLMDFGTVYKNYCSDITRTVFIGKKPLDDKLKKIYHIVLTAQQKAIEACKEGLTCGELDSKARKYITEMGYGEEFGHSLGHGVGLEVHEGPSIAKSNDIILKENMVITIEPGIYIPGLGGIRIEDMIVVKKNGCENLYSSKKEFTIIS
jgi:Xaa-Pro aminopeptidase